MTGAHRPPSRSLAALPVNSAGWATDCSFDICSESYYPRSSFKCLSLAVLRIPVIRWNENDSPLSREPAFGSEEV